MVTHIHQLAVDNWRGRYTSVILPVPGAELFHWLGGSLEASSINGAQPDKQSVIVGDPDISESYISLKGGTTFIQSDQIFDEQAEATYVAIGRTFDSLLGPSTRPVLIGTEGDGASNIHLHEATRARGWVEYLVDDTTTNNQNAPITVDDTSQFKCYFLIMRNGSVRLLNMTNSQASGLRTFTAPRQFSESPITIGGGLESRWQGTCDVVAAGYWPFALTPDERRTMYLKYLKPIAAARGIDI